MDISSLQGQWLNCLLTYLFCILIKFIFKLNKVILWINLFLIVIGELILKFWVLSIFLILFLQLANILGRFQWLTCPRKVIFWLTPNFLSSRITFFHSVEHLKLSFCDFQDLSTGWLECDPGSLFKPEYFTLPQWLPEWVSA